MSEPWVPEPPPEPHKPDPLPARCPHCFLLVRRMTYEEWFCPEHGIVRAWYGETATAGRDFTTTYWKIDEPREEER